MNRTIACVTDRSTEYRRFVSERLKPALTCKAPLDPHPREKRIVIYHLGAGAHAAHKFVSACWLVQQRLLATGRPEGFADRSSGNFAMGVAEACRRVGVPSRFVASGSPPPLVESFVRACGGDFVLVNNNLGRKAELEQLRGDGWHVLDQHANPQVIDAFRETVGQELDRELTRLGIEPAAVVGPVGTGGLLVGVTQALRRRGRHLEAVGVDQAHSIVHGPFSAWCPSWLKIRGVGSADERCATLRLPQARRAIDHWFARDVFDAARFMLDFRNCGRGCGMSGGLALAVAFLDVLPLIPNGRTVVVLIPDSPAFYQEEHEIAEQLFGLDGDPRYAR